MVGVSWVGLAECPSPEVVGLERGVRLVVLLGMPRRTDFFVFVAVVMLSLVL